MSQASDSSQASTGCLDRRTWDAISTCSIHDFFFNFCHSIHLATVSVFTDFIKLLIDIVCGCCLSKIEYSS